MSYRKVQPATVRSGLKKRTGRSICAPACVNVLVPAVPPLFTYPNAPAGRYAGISLIGMPSALATPVPYAESAFKQLPM